MTSEELEKIARQQPFEPFRIILTTGATYAIHHPDLIMIGRRSAVIGITKEPTRTGYDTTLHVDLLHIVGFEKPIGATSPSNGPTN